jgi:hypothetical protein
MAIKKNEVNKVNKVISPTDAMAERFIEGRLKIIHALKDLTVAVYNLENYVRRIDESPNNQQPIAENFDPSEEINGDELSLADVIRETPNIIHTLRNRIENVVDTIGEILQISEVRNKKGDN